MTFQSAAVIILAAANIWLRTDAGGAEIQAWLEEQALKASSVDEMP